MGPAVSQHPRTAADMGVLRRRASHKTILSLVNATARLGIFWTQAPLRR